MAMFILQTPYIGLERVSGKVNLKYNFQQPTKIKNNNSNNDNNKNRRKEKWGKGFQRQTKNKKK